MVARHYYALMMFAAPEHPVAPTPQQSAPVDLTTLGTMLNTEVAGIPLKRLFLAVFSEPSGVLEVQDLIQKVEAFNLPAPPKDHATTRLQTPGIFGVKKLLRELGAFLSFDNGLESRVQAAVQKLLDFRLVTLDVVAIGIYGIDALNPSPNIRSHLYYYKPTELGETLLVSIKSTSKP